jgi:hypothetical protein
MTFDRSVERMLDRQEIHDVLVRYSRGCDRGAYEALLDEVYHPGAVEAHGAYRGMVEPFFADYVGPGLATREYVQHHVTTLVIDFESQDVALVESYLWGLDVRREGAAYVERRTYGRYLDRFERRSAGGPWRIAHRTFVVDWASDQAFDQRPSYPPDNYIRGTRDRSDPLWRLHESGRAHWPEDDAAEVG